MNCAPLVCARSEVEWVFIRARARPSCTWIQAMCATGRACRRHNSRASSPKARSAVDRLRMQGALRSHRVTFRGRSESPACWRSCSGTARMQMRRPTQLRHPTPRPPRKRLKPYVRQRSRPRPRSRWGQPRAARSLCPSHWHTRAKPRPIRSLQLARRRSPCPQRGGRGRMASLHWRARMLRLVQPVTS